MTKPLIAVPMPTDYDYARRKGRLRFTQIALDLPVLGYRNHEEFSWALGQALNTAYKHSNLYKSHWIIVSDAEGVALFSAPGAARLNTEH